MRKLLLCVWALVIGLFVTCSCTKTPTGEETKEQANSVTICAVNDLHGALVDDGNKGIARVATFIDSVRSKADGVCITVSAGDMFQGSALSNYRHGEDTIKIMNEMRFDCMVIGNHEFDWGLDEILSHDEKGTSEVKANFPFLGCNISLDSEEVVLPENLASYTIIEEKGVKVGVVGYIGEGLEDDIATSMVKDYTFLSPVPVVKEIVKKLRTVEECNVVIAVGHDGSSSTDNQLANLTGEYAVDAIINGHTHTVYNDVYKRKDDKFEIQCTQSGTAASNVGVIEIKLDETTKKAKSSSSYNKSITSKIDENATVKKMIDDLVKETEPVFGEVLCKAKVDCDRIPTTYFAANALQDAYNVDCAFINGGGIRANAFPIYSGDNITVAKAFEIMPFDNTVKTTKLLGKYIIGILNTSDIYAGDNITGDRYSGYYIKGEKLDENKEYTVAAVDYIFDKDNMPFKQYGVDTVATGFLFRDVLINKFKTYTEGFDPNAR